MPGKSGRKIGRSKRAASNARYTVEGRQVKNKNRKVAKHQKNHPNDLQSTQKGVIIDYKRTKSVKSSKKILGNYR